MFQSSGLQTQLSFSRHITKIPPCRPIEPCERERGFKFGSEGTVVSVFQQISETASGQSGLTGKTGAVDHVKRLQLQALCIQPSLHDGDTLFRFGGGTIVFCREGQQQVATHHVITEFVDVGYDLS